MALKKPRKKTGPKEQRLKVEGDWTEAVGRMMKAGKPKAKKKRKSRAMEHAA